MKTISNLLILLCIVVGVAAPAYAVPSKDNKADELGWGFEYDDADRVTKITDPAGQNTRFDYNFFDAKEKQHLRERVKTAADGSRVMHEFDKDGRLVRMKDGAGVVTYGYDEHGWLKRVERQSEPAITYGRDLQGRITQMQVGDFKLDYRYDFLGRLSSINTPAGPIEYEYRAGQGEVERKYPNGIRTFSHYEPNGELRDITHGYFANPADTSYQVLAKYSYQYRPDGLIANMTEQSDLGQSTKTYDYDKVGRLIKADSSDGQTLAYEYDPLGNRLKVTVPNIPPRLSEVDWAGRITRLDGTPATHDAAGNLTSVTVGGEAMNYRYTPDNQLAEVSGKVSYRYNGEGCLIARKAGDVETRFIPDPLSPYWQPLVMETKGGSRTLIVWEGATPLLLIKDGKPEYLLHNHLGSVRLVADGQGKITQRFDYEPFGALLNPEAATDFAPRFAGLFWDAEAKAYLTLTRGYQPDLGRFMGVDPQHWAPLGSQKDLSVYAYSGDDPVNFVDLNGAQAKRPDQDFIDYINGGFSEIPNYEYGISVGFNSGIETDHELAEKAEGRVPVIFVWGSEGGSGVDFLRTGFWDHMGGSRTVIPAVIDTLYQHSAGNNTTGINVKHVYHLDADGVRLQPEDVMFKSNVYWATAGITTHFVGDGVGIGFTGHGNNPLQSFFDLASKVRYFGRGVGGMAIDTLSGKGTVYGHDIVSNLKELNEQRLIPLPGTYKKTDIYRIDANGIWHKSSSVINPPSKQTIDAPSASPQINSGIPVLEKMPSGIDHQRLQESMNLTDVIIKQLDTAKGVIRRYDVSGGAGRVAGPGGFASPSAEAALREFRELSASSQWRDASFRALPTYATPNEVAAYKEAGKYKAFEPSTVGGVYLGGAGQLLKGLGALEGIGKDANGNLILLGKSGGEIKLPPLRLDDVVTVFRSVYLNGEGPTVTIDPDPQNPKGPTMIIRHSEATDGTYVGWVLFHADRIMKGYNLGEDNITKAELKSKVSGYTQLLDTIYFGGDTKEESNWERFWIVPAEARRFAVIPDELTLFDVPLKVRTQPMKWESGKLVDDANRPPSVGATAFTEWFTGHYDGIDKEQYLIPPIESGITEPVPVFSELRRIALLTAMAEKLRDQGVPLPFWMRDYTVPPVPFEKTTPALEITRIKDRLTAHIYGGVSLSPDDSAVGNYSQPSDVKKLPQEQQAAAQKTLDRSASLAPVLRQQLQGAKTLQVKTFKHQGVAQQALALPGTDTLALAPAIFNEADLTVPMAGGGAIQLLRRYHSFFNPKGPWGDGWALDLPRLETAKLPVERDGQGHVAYRIVYDVVTPLNSSSARFSKIAEVPELNNSKLIVPDQPGEFLALADDEPLDFVTTIKKDITDQKDESNPMKLIRKDGSVWHFSPAGDLIATERAGLRTVYERDNGRVTGIVGMKGKWLAASIKLAYDEAGRLISAIGQQQAVENTTDKATMKYAYDASGKLASVSSDAGLIGYQYQGPKVVAVTYKGPGKDDAEQTVRRFEYNAQGQLLAEQDASGAKTQYRIAANPTGSTLMTTPSGKDAKPDSIQYDAAFRPLKAQYADGSKASWVYKDGVVMVLTGADDETIRLTESADQSQRTLELDPQRKLVGKYDSAGRLTQLTDNGLPLLHQEWESDGSLRLAADDNTAVHPQYDTDGLLSSVILSPPGELGKGIPWQETKLNTTGKPIEITDYTGLQVRLGYEKTGELQGMTIQRDGKNFGFTLKRDPSGRIETMDSSWDKQRFGYDDQGLLNRAEVDRDNEHNAAEWNAGRLVKISQFDGGETQLSYNDNGSIRQITTPNGLVLDYQHDPSGRLQEVAMGGTAGLSLAYDESGRVKRWVYHAGDK